MSRFQELVEIAVEAQPHHGVTLANGTYIEGYILDYDAESLVFVMGGPLADYDAHTRYHQSEIQSIWFTSGGVYSAHPI